MPCTLNLGSEAYSTEYFLNTLEHGTLRFDDCILHLEPVVVLWIVVVLCSKDTAVLQISRGHCGNLTLVLLCRGNISTMLCMCLTLSENISLIIQL